MPRITRGRGSTQTGTSAPILARGAQQARIGELEPVRPRDEAQRRGGVRRAAANPGGGRQALGQRETAELEAIDLGRERARRAQHQIVGDGARSRLHSGRAP